MSSNSFQGAIIFSAPSGAGKTTVVRYLLEKELPFYFQFRLAVETEDLMK